MFALAGFDHFPCRDVAGAAQHVLDADLDAIHDLELRIGIGMEDFRGIHGFVLLPDTGKIRLGLRIAAAGGHRGGRLPGQGRRRGAVGRFQFGDNDHVLGVGELPDLQRTLGGRDRAGHFRVVERQTQIAAGRLAGGLQVERPDLQPAASEAAGALRHGPVGLHVAAKDLQPQGIAFLPEHRAEHPVAGPRRLAPVAGQPFPEHVVAGEEGRPVDLEGGDGLRLASDRDGRVIFRGDGRKGQKRQQECEGAFHGRGFPTSCQNHSRNCCVDGRSSRNMAVE